MFLSIFIVAILSIPMLYIKNEYSHLRYYFYFMSFLGFTGVLIAWFSQFFLQEGCNLNGFHRMVDRHYHHFPEGYVLPAFLDNHDMDRFLFHCNQNRKCLMAAARELFRLPQPVILYYGTESGVVQERSMWSLRSHGDLMARCPMNWESIDKEVLAFFIELIADRQRR